MSAMELKDRVEFALRDAGFGLDEAFNLAAHLTQPAQSVDVAGAWREAAASCLGRTSRLFRCVCEEAGKLTAALTEKAK